MGASFKLKIALLFKVKVHHVHTLSFFQTDSQPDKILLEIDAFCMHCMHYKFCLVGHFTDRKDLAIFFTSSKTYKKCNDDIRFAQSVVIDFVVICIPCSQKRTRFASLKKPSFFCSGRGLFMAFLLAQNLCYFLKK